MYYPGANFSKQSVLIKELSYSAFYLLQSCLLSHSDFKFPCMPPHYINRSFVHDQVTRMFDVLMSLSSKTGACCSQWRYMTDITGTGRNGLVTFHSRHAATFQFVILHWRERSTDGRDNTLPPVCPLVSGINTHTHNDVVHLPPRQWCVPLRDDSQIKTATDVSIWVPPFKKACFT